MNQTLKLHFDGGSRGNPGPAGVGVVVTAEDGTPLVTLGRYIGRATNNVAEYNALIASLQEAQKLGAKRVAIHGDSELVIKQMRGEYRVKNPDLRVLYDKAMSLLGQFDHATLNHNRREENSLADRLANLAMDRKAEVTDVDWPQEGAASAKPLEIDLPSPKSPVAGERAACARCGCVIEIKHPSTLRPHQLKPFTCPCGNKMYST
jgi:ribonuclease HI